MGQFSVEIYALPGSLLSGNQHQVISLFRDHAIEPRIVHEARELQIAIGLVAAQEGMACLLYTSPSPRDS